VLSLLRMSPRQASMTAKSKANGAANTHTESYDPSHYIVPGQDHHGHSVRVWCRVQPSIDHEIDAIIQSKNWPFRVKGDFIRWAIYEAVKRMGKLKPVPNSMIVVADVIMDQCKQADLWLRFRSSIDTLEQTVKSFTDSGNEEEALKLLSSTRSQVLKLEEAMWRDQYLAELDKRFSHIWGRHRDRAVRLDRATKQ
jgi:hypothetical protein